MNRKEQRCKYNKTRINPWGIVTCQYGDVLAKVPRPPHISWGVDVMAANPCRLCKVFEALPKLGRAL